MGFHIFSENGPLRTNTLSAWSQSCSSHACAIYTTVIWLYFALKIFRTLLFRSFNFVRSPYRIQNTCENFVVEKYSYVSFSYGLQRTKLNRVRNKTKLRYIDRKCVNWTSQDISYSLNKHASCLHSLMHCHGCSRTAETADTETAAARKARQSDRRAATTAAVREARLLRRRDWMRMNMLS